MRESFPPLSKRAYFGDLLTIIVLVFILAVAFVASFPVISKLGDAMTGSKEINSTTLGKSSISFMAKASAKFDILIIISFVGLVIAFLVLSYFIPLHPVFAIAYFIFMAVAVLLSALVSNIFEKVWVGSLAAFSVKFPLTNMLMAHLPVVMVVVAFLGAIALFAKPQSGVGA